MKLNLAKFGNAQGGTFDVSEVVFGREYNEALVHQVVTAYLTTARQGTKQQKNRSDVSGGGIKPWRQKGTGRARAGSIRSPLWRKGGKVFAARPRDYTQKVNRKMFKGAMCAILSELLRQDRLNIVEDFSLSGPKTKELKDKLKAIDVTDALLVTQEVDENLYLSARNMRNIDACDVSTVDPVSLVGYKKIVMTKSAVAKFEEMLGS